MMAPPTAGLHLSPENPWWAVWEAMGEALLVADGEGRLVLSNPAAHRLFGSRLLQEPLSDWCGIYGLCTPEDVEPIEPEAFPLLRALRGESIEDEELLMCTPPSEPYKAVYISVTARPLADVRGVRQGAFAMFRDTTLMRETEGALLLRDRAIAEASEGISISDATKPDQPLIYVNQGFVRLTGYSREEALGRNCRFLQGPGTPPEAVERIRHALRYNESCVVELLNYRKDGTPFWNRLSLTPVRDAGGDVRHIIGVQSDITDRVRAEQRLAQATAELRAAHAHVLRNLEAAARVQRALLPPKKMRIEGVDFAWRFLPCDELAGDLLSIFELDDDAVAAYVFDVSGHGTAAGLMSVAINRLLQPGYLRASLVWSDGEDPDSRLAAEPDHVVQRLNAAFEWDDRTAQFFTIAYGVYHRRTREFRFVTAGHPEILLIPRRGEPTMLETEGIPVGIEDTAYEAASVQLGPGDRAFLFSDGITETMSPTGELFGLRRLVDTLVRYRYQALENQLDHLLEALEAWRGNAKVLDDLSLLAFGPAPHEARSPAT